MAFGVSGSRASAIRAADFACGATSATGHRERLVILRQAAVSQSVVRVECQRLLEALFGFSEALRRGMRAVLLPHQIFLVGFQITARVRGAKRSCKASAMAWPTSSWMAKTSVMSRS